MKMVLVAPLAACLLTPGILVAAAEELAVAGIVEYEAPSAEPATGLGDVRLVNMNLAGRITDERGVAAIDGNSHVCEGSFVQGEDGSLTAGAGYCVQSDAEGDVWWISWRGLPGDTEWTVIGGTGKFEGASGSGMTTAVSENPDGSSVIRYEGTLTLR
jgi:hypothetical protein